ncbi:amidohydrolase family protein [Pseudorhodoferax aquiterrae]|nr:amidohydrolase family protein [Pseudorhodoferax aquiterrae]
MHLYDPQMPFAGGPVLQHAEASVRHYRQLQHRLGITRNVVVQPSSYGTDNRVLVAGLRTFGGAARGVAVIDPSFTRRDLQLLDDAGVVGTRFNLVQAGATVVDMLEPVAEMVRPLGWHLQVHAPGGDLVQLADRLLALHVPLVIDHFARHQADMGDPRPLEQAVLRLLDSGRVWLKLSAPYIAAPAEQQRAALAETVRRWFDAFPERLVWGSDWPHVTEREKPDDAELMDLVAAWLPDTGSPRVLVDNPAQLYRFDVLPST